MTCAHEAKSERSRARDILRSVLAAATMTALTALGATTQTQNSSAPIKGIYYADTTPNIAGFWRRQGAPGSAVWIVDGKPLAERDSEGTIIGLPYTPAWLAVYKQRQAQSLAGRPYGDPHFNCWPRGPVSQYVSGNATMTITQTPGRVQQIFEEDTQVMNFYTDGRPLPPEADPTNDSYTPKFSGYSIGHWEGSTLVTDTRGIRKELTFGFLAPHSDVTDVVERFTRTDPTHLSIELIVTDKKALTTAMKTHLTFVLDPKGEFEDVFCTENSRNSTDKDGFLTTETTSRRSTAWDLPHD